MAPLLAPSFHGIGQATVVAAGRGHGFDDGLSPLQHREQEGLNHVVDPIEVDADQSERVAAAGIGAADDGESFGPRVLRHTFDTDRVRGRSDLAI